MNHTVTRPKRLFRVGLLLLAVLIGSVFAPVLRFDFVHWDDDINITGNPLLTAPWSWQNLIELCSGEQAMRLKTVYWLAARGVYSLFGFEPGAWHAVGLSWHLFTAGLFAIVLRRMLLLGWPQGGREIELTALLGAAVWAIHPLRAETLGWATAGTYPLTTLFILASFYSYLNWLEAITALRRRIWIVMAWFLAVAGYATYPIAVTYGLWLVVFDWWLERKGILSENHRKWQWGLKHLLFLAPAALSVGLTLWTRYHQPGIFSAAPDISDVGLPLRLLMALATLAMLVWRTVWPVNLTPNIAPLNLDDSAVIGWALFGASMVIIIFLTVWRVRQKWPGAILVCAGFAVLSIPCLGLTERPIWPVDRYSYLIDLVLMGGLAALVLKYASGKGLRLLVAGVVLIGVSASATRQQLMIWQDTDSLFTYMASEPNFSKNPRQAGHVYVLWARHLAIQNQPAEAAEKFNHAQAIYLQAIKSAVSLGDYEQALSLLSHQEHHFGLTPPLRREKGAWLLRLNRPMEALTELQLAATELPDDGRTESLLKEAEHQQSRSITAPSIRLDNSEAPSEP